MSAEDNVKIVQEMYRAFLRRDVPGILVHLDDDIIWTVPGSEISFPKRGRKAKKAALPPGPCQSGGE
jgi:ketosteroid isomerase-like protein